MDFQRLSVVRLCTPAEPPPDTSDDDAIQAAHLAYLGSLWERGIVAINGPVKAVDTEGWRGLTIYTVDVDEARELAMGDPAVQAGWFDVVVDRWLVKAVPQTVGTKVDLSL
jgi:uncharacterized protein YciI